MHEIIKRILKRVAKEKKEATAELKVLHVALEEIVTLNGLVSTLQEHIKENRVGIDLMISNMADEIEEGKHKQEIIVGLEMMVDARDNFNVTLQGHLDVSLEINQDSEEKVKTLEHQLKHSECLVQEKENHIKRYQKLLDLEG
jgi:hypothetical protein